MRPFEYASPATSDQAVSLLASAWGQSEILAGGTDLLALMKDDVVHPRRLVNIKDIKDLRGVRSDSTGVQVGALTTMGELADHADIRKNFPALAEALHEAASPQIRNMATIGGNLCQRPRCWYFRGGWGLLPKDEAGNDLVTGGENRFHAILANDGPAKFVSPSTVVPSLIAYGARVRLVGPQGKRELPLEKFFIVPSSENQREHDLKPNELITSVVLPHAGQLRSAHYEVRQKEVFDWPLTVAAVSLSMQGDTVQTARVVMGHVAPVPWISAEAAQALQGKPVNEQTAQQAAEAAVKNARPLSQNGYKVQLARVAVKRAILKAASGGAA
jgi:xanthine dehydrogenase YagS FAD-binding subunit